MSTYENSMKGGHPILGIVLAIIGIGFAVLSTLATGVIGGGIAIILGVVALLLGINARKSGRGIGAIVLGIIAIILAIIMIVFTVSIFNSLRDRAVESGEAPLVVQYANKPYLGVFGMALGVPDNEAVQREFIDQMNRLVEQYGYDGKPASTATP